MKKLIFALTLLISLSACGSRERNSLDDRIIPEAETGTVVVSNEPVEGILKAQEVKLNMYGTHILEDEMGAFIVYLQSKTLSLSAYLDAKVSVSGKIVKTFDGKTILEVDQVELIAEPDEEIVMMGDQMYISQKLGFNLNLPAIWKYTESEEKLEISLQNNEKLIEITRLENTGKKVLEKFVEEPEPVDLTINSYEAMRTISDNQINVYISAGENVYKIVFTPVAQTATEKSQFYALLKTFELNAKTEAEIHTKVCGGAAKIECDAGYRCETSSENEMATGLCVKVTGSGAEIDATGSGAEIAHSESGIDASAKTAKFQVIDYIDANIQNLLTEKSILSPQIEGYEFSENVVSVIFNSTDKKYKIQYRYRVIDEFEVELTEVAYFMEGDGRDWEKISGEDQQSDAAKEVIDATGEVKTVVLEDMRLYENTRQNYTIQYPRGWYYSSFGATGGALWHTGFGSEAVEQGNEQISVDIFSGKVDNVQESDFGGIFKVSIPRDETSHFEISGSTDLKETIRRMGETITQN